MNEFPRQKHETLPTLGNEVAVEIREKRKDLEEKHLVSIDMRLSPEERSILDTVDIRQSIPQFDAYEADGTRLSEQLTKHFSHMGQNSPEHLEALARIVTRLSDGIRTALGKDSSWTMVRVSMPHHIFDTPRWHKDGSYFDSDEPSYKLVATLKGPQTLFGTTDQPEKFEQLLFEQSRTEEREIEIAHELIEITAPIAITKSTEAAVYLVGGTDAAIHSEPSVSEPRIFMAVVPGSAEEVESWRARTER